MSFSRSRSRSRSRLHLRFRILHLVSRDSDSETKSKTRCVGRGNVSHNPKFCVLEEEIVVLDGRGGTVLQHCWCSWIEFNWIQFSSILIWRGESVWYPLRACSCSDESSEGEKPMADLSLEGQGRYWHWLHPFLVRITRNDTRNEIARCQRAKNNFLFEWR